MNSFVISALLLSSALVIDAGSVLRKSRSFGRGAAPLSAYGAGASGQASSINPVHTAFSGQVGAGSTSSFASRPAPIPVAILSSTFNAPGSIEGSSNFDYNFEAENGIKQQAVGETKFVEDTDVVTMKGSYEYVGEDGQVYTVTWYADETGFHASGDHLPKEVPIPFPEQAEAVAAQIAFAAQEDAAGGSSRFTGGGNTGFTGGNTGFTGGNTGFAGGNTGFNSGSSQGQFFAASNARPVLSSYRS